MTYAEAFELLVQLVIRFEGFRAKAYLCPANVWTIGYGETLGVKPGMVWTKEHAEAVLRTRLMSFLAATLKKCPALHLEPPERAVACTSLAYNIGVGAFSVSSVCKKTMAGDLAAAAKAFLLWNKAGGRVLPGLTLRRRLESEIYQLLRPQMAR